MRRAARRASGARPPCFVVSDHGAGGAARRVVHLNRRLEEAGLLAFCAAGSDRLARAARDAALHLLPPRVREIAFRRLRVAAARVESAARFGGHRLGEDRRLLRGGEHAARRVDQPRRPRGTRGASAPADYERARSDVIAALLDWKLPDGEPVVARARRREEVYAGPYVARAPDVVVELALDAGYGLSLVPTPRGGRHAVAPRLEADELAGGRGRGMNGTHRPEGIWIEHGVASASFPSERAELVDASAPILRALGLAADPTDASPARPRAYTPAEEALVAERLRRLGYLE